MNNLINNINTNTQLLNNYFVDPYILYIRMYNRLPHNLFIKHFDFEKGLAFLRSEHKGQIEHIFHKDELDCLKKKEQKERTIVVLKNEVVIDMGDDYCDIFYGDNAQETMIVLKKQLSGIKKRERKTSQEINIITRGESGLELVDMEIKRTSLNIDLHYDDDFKEVDSIIRKRLNKKSDKGIVLLHGLPGTGKTTYLRYLIGKIKKQVLFIPPNIAGRIANPELVKLLIDNPDSVLIIEDAENVIMQRQAGHDSSVSNLLNISDGLLSDFLNVQIICTFNSPISTVDDALLRKGRLIAKYEFRKLPVGKAQKLSDHLGYKTTIREPQSLAEIFNQNEKVYTESSRPLIGFRQTALAV